MSKISLKQKLKVVFRSWYRKKDSQSQGDGAEGPERLRQVELVSQIQKRRELTKRDNPRDLEVSPLSIHQSVDQCVHERKLLKAEERTMGKV